MVLARCIRPGGWPAFGGRGWLAWQFLGEFPEVAGGVAEGGGSHSPRAVLGAVDQDDALLLDLRAYRVDIVDDDHVLGARASTGRADLCGSDELVRLGGIV